MRLLIDLFRAADGHLEGVVHTPDAGSTVFAGMLDLLRVLEGIDLCPAAGPEPTGPDPNNPEDGDG